MRKIIASSVLALSFLSPNVSADALGLFVGGGSWNHDASGTFGTVGDDVIDVESDLGYDDENDGYVWAAFEHFVPLVPNIRVEASSIGHTGISGSVDFDGQTVSGASEIDLDATDATLYYRLLDNWVNLDLGLTVRNIEGDFTIDTATVSIDETIPMLYAAVQFDMPFTGLSIGGDINIVEYDDSTYQDVRFRALYEIGVIGFEAGLRKTTIELDDVDNVTSDMDFEGLMLGAFLHF